MKKHNTLWLLLLALCSIFAGCKKENTNTEEQLPPETQTGAYTFGCKVDGVIYKASGKGGLLGNQHVYYSYFSSDSSFNIGAGSIVDKKFSINITFKCSSLNIPCLFSSYPYEVIFQDDSNGTIPGNSNVYKTNNIYSGSAVVKYFNGTIAPGNFGTIASGTFQMDCVNANGKVIKITEGRFDIGA